MIIYSINNMLNNVLYIHAQGGLQTPRLVICYTETHLFHMLQHTQECNELGGNMARFTQFPIMITRSTIIYEIISPGAAGSSIYV